MGFLELLVLLASMVQKAGKVKKETKEVQDLEGQLDTQGCLV